MAKSTKPVSPARRKKIIADYAQCRNYSEVARKYGVTRNTVKNIVNGDPKAAELCRQKAEEQTKDALDMLNSRNDRMVGLVDDMLNALGEKVKKPDMFTNAKDLATALGILVDKIVKIQEIKRESGTSEGGVTIVDDL